MKKYAMRSLVCGALGVLTLVANVSAQAVDQIDNTIDCAALSYNLKLGSKDRNTNGDVTTLQTYLVQAGYLDSDPTGYFGNATKRAVKAFQSANGISPTGNIATYSRAKIKELSCTGQATSSSAPVSQNTNTTTNTTGNVTWSNQGASGRDVMMPYRPGDVVKPAPSVGIRSDILRIDRPADGYLRVVLPGNVNNNLASYWMVAVSCSTGISIIDRSSVERCGSDLRDNQAVRYDGSVDRALFEAKIANNSGTAGNIAVFVREFDNSGNQIGGSKDGFIVASQQVASPQDSVFSIAIPNLKGGGSLTMGESVTVTWEAGRNTQADSYSVSLDYVKGNGEQVFLGTALQSNRSFTFTVPTSLREEMFVLSFRGKGGSGGGSQMFMIYKPQAQAPVIQAPAILAFANKDPNPTTGSAYIMWRTAGNANVSLDMTCPTGSISFATDKGNHPSCEKGGVWSWQGQSSDAIFVTPTGNNSPVTVPFTLTVADPSGDYSKRQSQTINITFPATNQASIPAPVIQLFTIDNALKYSLTATNLSSVYAKADCPVGFVAYKQFYSNYGGQGSQALDSESICKQFVPMITYPAGQNVQTVDGTQGFFTHTLWDGKAYQAIVNLNGQNNTYTIPVTIRVCNSNNQCAEKSANYTLYPKG